MKKILPMAAVMAVALAYSVVPAQAQLVQLRGRVVDAVTEAPVYGASVRISGRGSGFVTDTTGMFMVQLWTQDTYVLSIEQLGYRTLLVSLPATAPEEFTTLMLQPDPIVLEGLEVLVDRFEQRRHFYTGSVSTLPRERLMQNPAMSAYSLVMANVPSGGPCGIDQVCSVQRGRRTRIRLCIDDEPAYAPVTDLERLSASDLYLIEIYERGQDVRVYTTAFVQDALGSGTNLDPIQFGCGG